MSFAPRPTTEPVAIAYARPPAVVESSALDLTLRALRPILTDRDVTEICINRPGEAYVETREGWRCVPLEFASFEWCQGLAKLVANSTKQRIDAESPLLSAALPGGKRIQIVLPPATTPGTVAITIRRPADELWTLDELHARGIFRTTRRANEAPDETEAKLLELLVPILRLSLRLRIVGRFLEHRVDFGDRRPHGPRAKPFPGHHLGQRRDPERRRILGLGGRAPSADRQSGRAI